jgi:hypothetical protein
MLLFRTVPVTRWHNRGDTVARVMAVTIGAHQELDGTRPV